VERLLVAPDCACLRQAVPLLHASAVLTQGARSVCRSGEQPLEQSKQGLAAGGTQKREHPGALRRKAVTLLRTQTSSCCAAALLCFGARRSCCIPLEPLRTLLGLSLQAEVQWMVHEQLPQGNNSDVGFTPAPGRLLDSAAVCSGSCMVSAVAWLPSNKPAHLQSWATPFARRCSPMWGS